MKYRTKSRWYYVPWTVRRPEKRGIVWFRHWRFAPARKYRKEVAA